MKTAKRVLKYIKSYRIYIILSLITAALSVAGTLYIPVLAGDAIDLISQRNFGGIGIILASAAVVAVLTAISTWVMNICNNKITYSVARDLRKDIFIKLGKLPVSYTDTRKTGETVSLATADTESVADGLLMGFTQFFTGILTILGTLGFMLAINFKIAIAVFILTPLSLFVSKFIATRTYEMFKKQSEVRAKQTGLIDEYISNYKVVKAFSAEEKVTAEFDSVNAELKDCSFKAVFYSSLTNPSTRFVNAVVYASVALIGAISVIGGGGLTVGGLSCLLSYANQYTKPFNEISGVITELQGALASAARVFELLDEREETEKSADLGTAEGNIEFKNVRFSYIPERPLIENFNLNVKKGQTVAVVGPTGCGKTTLINLIMRFYDTCGGSITVDGVDIKDVTRESLRKNFGMVLQDTWLKSGTIKENIKMAKPDATDEEVINAAKASHAHSFIKRTENGYDTYLGEDGGGLSAGQRQLLCIARVMLLNPNILILDEATSSIDTHTEVKIQKAFDRLTAGRTAFIVAHRLSTIQNADVILVMKDGHIIEQGKHDELLEKGGFYHKLYMSRIA